MATEPGTRAGHPTIDPDALYREEIYTDRAMGLLRVMRVLNPSLHFEEKDLRYASHPSPNSFCARYSSRLF